MPKTKFRLAIWYAVSHLLDFHFISNEFAEESGGGIGGLTLAAVLGRFSHDIQVDIYEAAAEFSEIGAGISIWRRTWRIMEFIGLDEGLKRNSEEMTCFSAPLGSLPWFASVRFSAFKDGRKLFNLCRFVGRAAETFPISCRASFRGGFLSDSST